MRKIKFREWQKEIKEMSYEPYLHEFEDLNTQVNDCDRIFMQYTGLKDKNGVEIYEGDIVCKNKNIEVLKDISKVIFENGAFCIDKIITIGKLQGKLHLGSFCKEYEVVGNIYENTELLKES